MTINEIIKEVRWCIDEESNNTSDLADAIDEKDDSYMDNIIKAKIPDALHWISVTANSSPLLSSSSDAKMKTTDAAVTANLTIEAFNQELNIGKITMPSDVYVFNVGRVRCEGWFKAVIPVEDTDDAALMMFDTTAMGSNDRPQAAIMREDPLAILIQPMPRTSSKATVSYVGVPKGTTKGTDGSLSVEISDKYKSAFIYYIAFLLLSAYDDSKANQMYSIALQQLGSSAQSK